jgi:hypothetical protein
MDQAFSDGESAIRITAVSALRRESFDLARTARANAHGMGLSAIGYGKRA